MCKRALADGGPSGRFICVQTLSLPGSLTTVPVAAIGIVCSGTSMFQGHGATGSRTSEQAAAAAAMIMIMGNHDRGHDHDHDHGTRVVVLHALVVMMARDLGHESVLGAVSKL